MEREKMNNVINLRVRLFEKKPFLENYFSTFRCLDDKIFIDLWKMFCIY